MLEGIVSHYSEDKGFGFITCEVHGIVIAERNNIDIPGYKTLVPGERVKFDIEKTLRGPVARNIQKKLS